MISPIEDYEAAAFHWFAGVIQAADVPARDEPYDLSGWKLTIKAPDGAGVQRATGSLGNGYEEAPPQTLSLAAALLFIRAMCAAHGISGRNAVALFRQAIITAQHTKPKTKDLMLPEAVEAICAIEAELPAYVRRRRKTEANRLGVAHAKIALQPPKKFTLFRGGAA